ncbi:MAG: dihydrolipoamide acetyltransferase family protein [Anaerolineales bacterium]
MPVPFIMPKFDMDQEKATIVSWAKGEGDFIKAEETVLMVETEKVAIDVPAPATGILAGIRYQAGDVVPVTTIIAYILEEGETRASLPQREMAPVIAAPTVSPTDSVAFAPVPVTPIASRLAKEKGVNLSEVTVEGERITRKDVERYLNNITVPRAAPLPTSRVTVPATPAARRLARESGLELEAIRGSGPGGRIQAVDINLAAEEKGPSAVSVNDRPARLVPLAGMRQKIAERMTASFHDIPHIALTVEADVSALEASRTSLGRLFEQEEKGKLSITALLVKIIAWALERNPYINASLKNGQIYLWQDINIGVATALPNGLIVPVIRQANKKSIREIAIALTDLRVRAEENKLALEDVQRGTFTISNLGMFGIHQFRAVINPPESAILAIGAIIKKPVVIGERDEVAVRPMLTATLSADHRVIDGVVAARFLQDFVQGVEVPASLSY